MHTPKRIASLTQRPWAKPVNGLAAWYYTP
jgi:hypothetical protein